MRIIQLMPGAGGTFYCDNCIRDAGLLRALRRQGHDALSVPLYLPPQLEGLDAEATAPIFFGGINVYLQQTLGLFRRTPRWLDRLLDAPPLLRWAARRAGMTRATTLARTTISMLRGEDGRQVKELDRLVAWLAAEQRPHVVCLSNALLLGLARRIKQALDCPVLCLLQDEDIFVDGFPEPWRAQTWQVMAERARDVDAFVAVSHYYAGLLRQRLDLPAERVHVVYSGISAEDYQPAAAAPDPPVVGFLERMCPEKGLDVLVEAFIRLKARPELARLRLRAGGGWTSGDRRYLREIRRRLFQAGVADDVEGLPNLDREERIEFLRSLSVLSVPARHPEAFGMYVLEALAAGVPVVLPRRGAFPELVEATGGGLLCEPDDAGSLAAAIAELLLDPERARQLGERGRQAVLERFTIDRAAGDFAQVCRQVVDPNPG